MRILTPMSESEFMKTVTLTITLPRALAEEARQADLLTSESLAALLKSELRQRRIKKLFAAVNRLDENCSGILNVDEISAEIEAARARRR